MATKEVARTENPARDLRAPAVMRRMFDPFAFLQSEIDRVFENMNGDFLQAAPMRQRPFWPSMEVREDDAAIEVTAEMPGMSEGDVDISVRDGLLTIRGEKKSEKEDKSKTYRLYERSYGAFERSMALPAGVDAARVKAKLVNGILHVTVPKPAGSAGHKIAITRG